MKSTSTKFLFFTGKGGVGKTSLACATAVQLADEGKKVLLISTDPASNLEDVLATPVQNKITSHQAIGNLFTMNINPETAADAYRERVLTALEPVSSPQQLLQIKEGLSGACTTEIASFDEFSRFVTGEGYPETFDKVIFDTAPTGHTLRLLELPAAWDTFLENNPGGASCIGPSSALKSNKDRYRQVVKSLRDASQTAFFLVSRPDAPSLKEAARTSSELKELGMGNQVLLINGLFKAMDQEDAVALKTEKIAAKELSQMPAALKSLERMDYPLLPYNILGVDKLRSLFDIGLQKKIIDLEISVDKNPISSLPDLPELVDALEAGRHSGLIMTMGKGGVGKTIIAASIACLLAKRGHQVLLTTTDPAAHVNDFMNQLPEVPENITIERIDPKLETKAYTDKIVAQKGKDLDEEGRKLLVEDLKSPCTEEVAVFNAFARVIRQAKRLFVVMDTAPTGHTLLLLDTTGSYHKEVIKFNRSNPEKITTPLMALQDRNFARILLVTLPETTPMREAEALQQDLIRAGIFPYGWIINQSLSAVKELKDPVLKKRASCEKPVIDNIRTRLSNNTYVIPYLPEAKLLPAILARFPEADKKNQAVNV